MKITFQTPPKYLDEKLIFNVLRDYKMLNCEVLIRDEYGMFQRPTTVATFILRHTATATIDDFIDVIMKDHRKYIRW